MVSEWMTLMCLAVCAIAIVTQMPRKSYRK